MVAGIRQIEAGRAFVRIGIEDRLSKALAVVQGRIRSFANSISRIGAQLQTIGFGATVFGASFTAAFGTAIRAAGDLTETQAALEGSFQSLGSRAAADANSIATGYRRVATDVKNAQVGFFGFFRGLGVAATDSQRLSTQLSKLSLDFSSRFNLPDEDGFRRFLSGLAGSTEVLQRFGVSLRRGQVNEVFKRLGVRETIDTATEQQKALAKTLILIRSLGPEFQNVAGDVFRTQDQFVNALKSAQAAIKEFGEQVGLPITEALAPVLLRFRSFFQRLSELAKANPKIVSRLAAVAASVTALGVSFLSAGITARVFAFSLGGIVQSIRVPLLLLVRSVDLVIFPFVALANRIRGLAGLIVANLLNVPRALLGIGASVVAPFKALSAATTTTRRAFTLLLSPVVFLGSQLASLGPSALGAGRLISRSLIATTANLGRQFTAAVIPLRVFSATVFTTGQGLVAFGRNTIRVAVLGQRLGISLATSFARASSGLLLLSRGIASITIGRGLNLLSRIPRLFGATSAVGLRVFSATLVTAGQGLTLLGQQGVAALSFVATGARGVAGVVAGSLTQAFGLASSGLARLSGFAGSFFNMLNGALEELGSAVSTAISTLGSFGSVISGPLRAVGGIVFRVLTNPIVLTTIAIGLAAKAIVDFRREIIAGFQAAGAAVRGFAEASVDNIRRFVAASVRFLAELFDVIVFLGEQIGPQLLAGFQLAARSLQQGEFKLSFQAAFATLKLASLEFARFFTSVFADRITDALLAVSDIFTSTVIPAILRFIQLSLQQLPVVAEVIIRVAQTFKRLGDNVVSTLEIIAEAIFGFLNGLGQGGRSLLPLLGLELKGEDIKKAQDDVGGVFDGVRDRLDKEFGFGANLDVPFKNALEGVKAFAEDAAIAADDALTQLTATIVELEGRIPAILERIQDNAGLGAEAARQELKAINDQIAALEARRAAEERRQQGALDINAFEKEVERLIPQAGAAAGRELGKNAIRSVRAISLFSQEGANTLAKALNRSGVDARVLALAQQRNARLDKIGTALNTLLNGLDDIQVVNIVGNGGP